MPKTKPRESAIIFGEIFRRLRVERGWTIRACAERVGITASHLGIIESGRNLPGIHVILLFGHVFGINGWEIFREFEETQRAQIAAEVAAEEA
jgi:XRE family transcriptional regulator, fatty acid utilization regulator